MDKCFPLEADIHALISVKIINMTENKRASDVSMLINLSKYLCSNISTAMTKFHKCRTFFGDENFKKRFCFF